MQLFELVTGQPPFDVIMLTPPILVQQMTEFAADSLPLRWHGKWQEMQEDLTHDDHRHTLQEWLEKSTSTMKNTPSSRGGIWGGWAN